MADQDLSHTAEIIKAAIPFVDNKLKGMAEIFAKLLDFMGSFKAAGKSGTLTANGLQKLDIDFEGMLKGIRPVCSQKEREIVDKILNIFNMKRMFEMYNNMMSAMDAMQGFGGFNEAGSGNDTDNVTNNFNSSNFESIFQSFKNNSSEEATSVSAAENSDSMDSESNDSYISKEPREEETSDSKVKMDRKEENTGSPMNSKMLDMLKTMVPPEQMSTFENLSMLFNTMSYDNNSKPDESKEQNNG